MDRREIDRLDEMAARESILYMQRQALEFIDCAVNLAAHTSSIAEVRAYLRALEQQLAEFG